MAQGEATVPGRFELMESAPDAIVIVGATGRIEFANAQTEALFGYSQDDLLGQTIDLLVPERLRDRHRQHRQGYAQAPRARAMGVGMELLGRRKDGSEFPVEISLSPVRVDGLDFVASAIRDITQRKRFERELQRKNVELQKAGLAKDRFLASMSHELRTPLNAIIGFTGTLLMGLPGPLTPEQQRQLTIVQTSARHLLSLINDMLDLAKIESGKTEIRFETVCLADVIAGVADSLRSLAQEKGLAFEISVPPELRIETDRRALRQILINLTNNAIKYTPHGGVRIDAVADAPGQRLTIAVSDTGIGIRPEDRPRLFQAFEQLDASNTRRYEGTGLGLYVSLRLAQLVGGSLHLTDSSERGSTFTLSLPLAPPGS